jgi:hypothetical protein
MSAYAKTNAGTKNSLGFTFSAGQTTRKKLKGGVSSNNSISGVSPRMSTKNATAIGL